MDKNTFREFIRKGGVPWEETAATPTGLAECTFLWFSRFLDQQEPRTLEIQQIKHREQVLCIASHFFPTMVFPPFLCPCPWCSSVCSGACETFSNVTYLSKITRKFCGLLFYHLANKISSQKGLTSPLLLYPSTK